MTFPTLDLPACIGLVVIGVVSGLAITYGGAPGLTVAAGGVGAIGGWLKGGDQIGLHDLR